MKKIPLSQGQYTLVDDGDFEWLSKRKWYASKDYNTFYALREVQKNYKSKNLLMHREIMKAPKGMQVDHIDGNGLNNQKSNLRLCTPAQNQRNRRLNKNNTSGYRGVCWFKDHAKWSAYFYIRRPDDPKRSKRIHIGFFDDPIEAAHAFDKAVIEQFDEFAKTNFPRSAA
jgi:hypothetical protein